MHSLGELRNYVGGLLAWPLKLGPVGTLPATAAYSTCD